MSRPGFLDLAWRFRARVRERGLRDTLREGLARLADPASVVPLARVDDSMLLASDAAAVRAAQKKRMRASSLVVEASNVAATYPNAFEREGRVLRYAWLPATETRLGLVVLFHGHNAFHHLGPVVPWRRFDVLAPWDTFGWNRQGSWFWGERGEPFVARLVARLVEERRSRHPGEPWFCVGASMGGFAAVYHGITLGCHGIYAMAPQVDLRLLATGWGGDQPDDPFGHLAGGGGDVPSLVDIAAAQEQLPPLFLVQNQFDPVNPFADHGFRLLDVYNRKRAWYGARVAPALGHGGDGSQEEAELFFATLARKRPPRRMPPGASPRTG